MSNPTFAQTVNFLKNYNMSHAVNNIIQEEIAAMIAQMRPDLSAEEVSECYRLCWNRLPETPYWDTEVKKIINSFNRKEEVIA